MVPWLKSNRLYQRVYSDEVLTESWRKVRTNSQAAGSDGITVPQFESRLFANLKRLQQELERQQYAPQAPKRISVPKANGKRRSIGILTLKDRIVQRAVLEVIEPLFEPDFEGTSYGFRPSRSTQQAVEHVLRLMEHGLAWGVDLDIESCFDRIPLQRLYRRVSAKVKDQEVLRLIANWLKLGAFSVERKGFMKQQQLCGLLQGSPLSPLFSNIYLDQFDKFSHNAKLNSVRFADDIIILARSEKEAKAKLAKAQKCLAALGLETNPQKTTIVSGKKGFIFLGYKIMLLADESENGGRAKSHAYLVSESDKLLSVNLAAASGLNKTIPADFDVLEDESGV